VITAFAAAIVLTLVWVLVELRHQQPMLDPRLFRIPAVTGASLGLLVTFFGSFGLFYLNASLLQYRYGYSVMQAGSPSCRWPCPCCWEPGSCRGWPPGSVSPGFSRPRSS
jgi:hypothetical protein